MPKNKKKSGETTLSGRNTVETLNDLTRIINMLVPEGSKLPAVSSPKDLFALRQKIKSFSAVTMIKAERHEAQQQHDGNQIKAALANIATNAWRARNKMIDTDNGETKEEMKRVYRHIEAQFDSLNQIGVEVRDFRGRPYDAGMALKVISFEPQPGLSRDEVMETIKPTVTWNGQLLQMGEVIVGTPQSK